MDTGQITVTVPEPTLASAAPAASNHLSAAHRFSCLTPCGSLLWKKHVDPVARRASRVHALAAALDHILAEANHRVLSRLPHKKVTLRHMPPRTSRLALAPSSHPSSAARLRAGVSPTPLQAPAQPDGPPARIMLQAPRLGPHRRDVRRSELPHPHAGLPHLVSLFNLDDDQPRPQPGGPHSAGEGSASAATRADATQLDLAAALDLAFECGGDTDDEEAADAGGQQPAVGSAARWEGWVEPPPGTVIPPPVVPRHKQPPALPPPQQQPVLTQQPQPYLQPQLQPHDPGAEWPPSAAMTHAQSLQGPHQAWLPPPVVPPMQGFPASSSGWPESSAGGVVPGAAASMGAHGHGQAPTFYQQPTQLSAMQATPADLAVWGHHAQGAQHWQQGTPVQPHTMPWGAPQQHAPPMHAWQPAAMEQQYAQTGAAPVSGLPQAWAQHAALLAAAGAGQPAALLPPASPDQENF